MRAPRCCKRTSAQAITHLPMSHLRATRRRIATPPYPPRPLKRKELKIGPFEVSPTTPRFPGGFPPTAKGVYLPNFSFFYDHLPRRTPLLAIAVFLVPSFSACGGGFMPLLRMASL
ncbi:hypothetical protein CDAR_402931 [Caerostris darwini]|uniref:Uncharacterized protein n=1 Tax=Caerostris darwini TaxID=1538125 RepID=A0AAV4WZN4_9ARAC|nr:hypothetical protein CDAR_402931 [Caerostris darwini]